MKLEVSIVKAENGFVIEYDNKVYVAKYEYEVADIIRKILE